MSCRVVSCSAPVARATEKPRTASERSDASGGSGSAKRKRKSTVSSTALGAAIAPERTFNVWTAEQLDALNAAAAEQGLTEAKMDDRWEAVAEKVGHGRSASACRHRWATLQQGKGAPGSKDETAPGAEGPDTAEGTASATWESRKAESSTKIFIGNARAVGGEDELIQFFAAADDEDNRVGGMLTELHWLSGKADGSCFARCSSAAAANAALALNGTKLANGQQLLVQLAHEVSFKSVVPQLKALRPGGGVSSIGQAPQLPVPKGCRGVFLSNLSFALDEATLEWWCNDTVGGSGADNEGGMVSAVRFLTAADQASKKNDQEKPTAEVESAASETVSTASQVQKQKQKQNHKHKHRHAGCAIVEFKKPAAQSIEKIIAKHGSSLLSRPVAVKFARAEWKNNKTKRKPSRKKSSSKPKKNKKTDQEKILTKRGKKDTGNKEGETTKRRKEKNNSTTTTTTTKQKTEHQQEEAQPKVTSPAQESIASETGQKKLRPRKRKKTSKVATAAASAEPNSGSAGKPEAAVKSTATKAKAAKRQKVVK